MAKKKNIPEIPTIAVLAEAYIAALQMDGRTGGTAASYQNDLKVAAKYLGADCDIRGLTPDRVQAFFDCDLVMKKRDSSPKNAISIAKTRRILRLALCWAVESGWIDVAPIPVATKAERVDADIDDAPVGLAAGALPVATAPDMPEPPAPGDASDPVADLPRFDHADLAPETPVEVAPKKATKKVKTAKAS